MSDPITRIIREIPASFFTGAQEQLDAAFVKAAKLAEERIAPPERQAILSQLRHAYSEEGFRAAAQEVGLVAATYDTCPAGGRYSLVSKGGVYIVRSNVQTHCGTPRATRFRSEFSAFNAWLSPQQLDLLVTIKAPPTDRICAMLVATAHRKGGDQTVPAFVGLGIPRGDLSGWLHLEPLATLLGRYHDLDTARSTPVAAPVEIRDIAVPRLKRRPSENTD